MCSLSLRAVLMSKSPVQPCPHFACASRIALGAMLILASLAQPSRHLATVGSLTLLLSDFVDITRTTFSLLCAY